MNKLDLQTPDFVADNAEKLAALFPNCVTETRNPHTGGIKRAIDFDLLRQELAYDLVEGPQERYRLDWPGKREALALANEPIRKNLRPCKEESVDFETTQNLYLEGDNLDALKLLQETYLGKVKMIYIDPPYNTGNDFIYDDNFSMSREEYEDLAGARDEEGNAMFQEEKWKQNSSSNGRFHSEWLSMMYPRLKLARNLLREDGVFFISIDDGEVANLRRICDEVFGPDNFLAALIWEKGRKNDARYFSSGHEYMIVYARSVSCLRESGIQWREVKPGATDIQDAFDTLRKQHGDNFTAIESDLKLFYKSLPKDHPAKAHARYNKVDKWGVWRDDNMSWPGGGGPRYDVMHPKTGKSCAVPPGGWRYSTPRAMEEAILSGKVVFRDDHTEPPIRKTYLVNRHDPLEQVGLQVAGTYFYRSSLQAASIMDSLFGQKVFDYPKDHEVIARFISYVATDPDSIILDFFSGSATTAHAVMQLNAEDGGKRRHIMVQLPEPCDEKSEAFKAGYKTIAEIGKERIRRAGQKILSEWQAKQAKEKPAQGDLPLAENSKLNTETSDASPPDIGFRVLKIDSSNMADVYYQPDEITQDDLALQVDNLKPGRGPEDLLFQVLLDWGVDLALPITEEKILKRRVFFVAENALAACFDTGLDEAFVKELAKRQPLRAVFRDSSYATDAAKINFEQIFKALSPHTELKTL